MPQMPSQPAHARSKTQAGDPIDCTNHVLDTLDKLQIDALIAIGGDDTLSYAARLHREGMKVMACPKNDGQRRFWHRLLHRLRDRGRS